MRQEKLMFGAGMVVHGFHMDLFTTHEHDIMINTYNLRHTCNNKTRNYLYNAKFIFIVFRERITEQPNKRVVKLQYLIGKMFKFACWQDYY